MKIKKQTIIETIRQTLLDFFSVKKKVTPVSPIAFLTIMVEGITGLVYWEIYSKAKELYPDDETMQLTFVGKKMQNVPETLVQIIHSIENLLKNYSEILFEGEDELSAGNLAEELRKRRAQ